MDNLIKNFNFETRIEYTANGQSLCGKFFFSFDPNVKNPLLAENEITVDTMEKLNIIETAFGGIKRNEPFFFKLRDADLFIELIRILRSHFSIVLDCDWHFSNVTLKTEITVLEITRL